MNPTETSSLSSSHNHPHYTITMLKEAIRVIHPFQQQRQEQDRMMSSTTSSRFSQLLLEHGEKHLQDWAVVCYSQPIHHHPQQQGNDSIPNNNQFTANGGRINNSVRSSSNCHHQQHNNNPNNYDYPSVKMTKLEGRLHLCSRSLVLEPLDASRGIVRCPFVHMEAPPREFPNPSQSHNSTPSSSATLNHSLPKTTQRMTSSSPNYGYNDGYDDEEEDVANITTTGSFAPMCIEFRCQRHVVMKTNNVIAPFDTITIPIHVRCTFLHSTPESFVELCHKLFHIMNHKSKQQHHGTNGNLMATNNNSNNTNTSAGTSFLSTPELDDLLQPMLDRPFDSNNIVDVLRERPLLWTSSSNVFHGSTHLNTNSTNYHNNNNKSPTLLLRCWQISPLQSKPGCCMVTSERLYFQPAKGVIADGADTKAMHWLLRNVVATARRYHGLADSAMEIFFKDGSSVLLALERRHEREQVLRLIQQQGNPHYSNNTSNSATANTTSANHPNIPCHTDRQFVIDAAREWQHGNLSNYEYLLALNSAAGRSFHDLSRYPVMPWVIADYKSSKLDLNNPNTFRDLSKPIGALHPERLQYFQTRLEGMQDIHIMGETPLFLYGTHYSAPGYVLYYLIRSMPEHMLCLQNGKFDAPDRIFHSISHCYNCVLSNHADLKELIPEFYNPDGSVDFLINARSLQLGATQNGDRVNDVDLPPWAKSPRDFLKKNRKALESEVCTLMLPKWIDLIFGCKSRGDAAMEAWNLFHPCAYLGPADLGAMESKDERFQAELQATEFGIVPDMLFTGPHPDKKTSPSSVSTTTPSQDLDVVVNDTADFVSPNIGRASSGDDTAGGKDAWELLDAPTQLNAEASKSSNHHPSQADERGFDDDDDDDDGHDITDKNVPPRPSHDNHDSLASNGGVGFGSVMMLQSKQHNKQHTHESSIFPTSTTTTNHGNKPETTAKNATISDNVVHSDRPLSFVNHNESIEIAAFESDDSAARGRTRSENFVFPLRGSGERVRNGNGFLLLDSKIPAASSSSISAGSTSAVHTHDVTRHLSFSSDGSGSGSGEWEMTIIERKKIHGDTISGCRLLLSESGTIKQQSYLATVSLDGGMIVHLVTLAPTGGGDDHIGRRTFTGTLSRLSYMAISRGQVAAGLTSPSKQAGMGKLTEFRRHSSRDPLACLAVASDGHGGHVAFSGGHDDVVLAYGINTACAVASVYSHRDAVTGIDLIARPDALSMIMTDGSSYLWLENSTHIMVSGSWDATVKVWSVTVAMGETVSIHREPLAELFDAESSIVGLTAIPAPNGGLLVAAGCSDGGFIAWNCHNNGVNVVIHKEPSRRGSGPCSAIKWICEGVDRIHLFVGFSTGKVASFSLADGMLRKASAVALGVAVHCLDHAPGMLLVGCADGGLRLLPLRDGAYFHSKPTWPAANDKTGQPITCVSIATTTSSPSSPYRSNHNGHAAAASVSTSIFGCTGTDDGTVAVFELKRATATTTPNSGGRLLF